MKTKHFLSSIVAHVMLLFCMAAAVHASDAIKVTVEGTFDYERAYEVLRDINVIREEATYQWTNGDPLVMDQELMDVAMQRAAELQLVNNSAGKRPDKETDFHALTQKANAENIVVGPASAEQAVQAWKANITQNANIINGHYKSAGVGCFYQGGNHAPCWVILFGTGEAVEPSKPVNQIKTASIMIDKSLFKASAQMVGILGVGSDFTVTKGAPASLGISFLSANQGFDTYGSEPVMISTAEFTFRSDKNKVLSVNKDTGVLNTTKVGTANITCQHRDAADILFSQKFTVTSSKCCTVVLNPCGGKLSGANSNSGQQTILVERGNAYGPLSKPSRKGYKFLGWYTDDGANGSRVKASSKVKIDNGNIQNLYAHWEKIKVDKMSKPALSAKNSKKVQVSWKPISGVSGYLVVLSNNLKFDGSKTEEIYLDGASKKSCTFAGLKPGKKYYVHIRAFKLDSRDRMVYGKYSSTAVITMPKK